MRRFVLVIMAIIAGTQTHAQESAEQTPREQCLMYFEQWSYLDPREADYWDRRPILKGQLKVCMDQQLLTKEDIAEAYYNM